MELHLPNNCEFCQSKNLKKSVSYPDMYFCSDCKNGGKMLLSSKVGNIKYEQTSDPFTLIKKDENGNVIDIITWEI